MAVRIGNKTYGADASQTGMGAQADTEPDPTDTNEPAEQAQGEPQEGEGTQVSQQEANYRRSNGRNCCGLCMHFVKEGDQATGFCTEVDGDITPYGLSDRFASVGNPFGPLPPAQRLRKAERRLAQAQARMVGPPPQAAQQGQGPSY